MNPFSTRLLATALNGVKQRSRFRGCLLGGAVGDALGAPVEFLRMLSSLQAREAPRPGARSGAHVYGRTGAVTENTQMALFTADGLLRASHRHRRPLQVEVVKMVHDAYLRWARTQTGSPPTVDDEEGDWLLSHRELWEQRTPRGESLAALRTGMIGTTQNPANDSAGSGAVTRVAPVGLWAEPDEAFAIGVRVAALTHGSPRAYLAAGAFAEAISVLVAGGSIEGAFDAALASLGSTPGSDHVATALDRGRQAARGEVTPEAIARLGEGWTANEALSIAVCCALAAGGDFSDGVRAAADHSGDTDSTAALTGTILGVHLGVEAIPARWIEALELHEAIAAIADDLYACRSGDTGWEVRYPVG